MTMTSTTDAGGFTLRRAELGDFEGMCRLVSQLTVLDGPRGPPTRDDWARMLAGAVAREHHILVAEDSSDGALLATASLIVEHKLARGCGRVGHVEDVVTDARARGRGLGGAILARLAELAHELGCYKASARPARSVRARPYLPPPPLADARLPLPPNGPQVILDCAEKNSCFYEKNGYRRAEVQMRLDLDPSRSGFGAHRSARTAGVSKPACALLAVGALLLLSARHARRH